MPGQAQRPNRWIDLQQLTLELRAVDTRILTSETTRSTAPRPTVERETRIKELFRFGETRFDINKRLQRFVGLERSAAPLNSSVAFTTD